jgi:hypothetical protein
MNPEQQRIAIAEACGWEPIPEGYYHPDNPIGQTMPDYLNDLNAMREAEASLFGTNYWVACKYERLITRMASSWAWHATASQRAEAFLRTIGKWEEGK